jgi:uncharacterized protein YndB with AHSA1/START domain
MLTTSQTRTISIDAPPDTVLDLVGDPRRLPAWAPNFARSVRADGGDWIVDDGARETAITVRVDREHGTVDLLAAGNPRRGAFSRVVPNGDGSEYLFTLFFPDGTDTAAITRQMAIVDEELHAVRRLCKRPG